MSRNLVYFQPVKCYVVGVFLKQRLSFSGELRHFMEKCNQNSKGRHDSVTTAEVAAGDRLCCPGLVKIQHRFSLFIY